VEELLREEFADELGEEEAAEDAGEEEVRESMLADIRNNYEAQTSMLDLAREPLQEAQVPRFRVDGGRRAAIVEFLVRKRLARFLDSRDSLFERVYALKLKTAVSSFFMDPQMFREKIG